MDQLVGLGAFPRGGLGGLRGFFSPYAKEKEGERFLYKG